VAFDNLVEKKGPGKWFSWLGRLTVVDYDQEEFERIKIAANKIREQSDVLLVIGIGGSYLGPVQLLMLYLLHSANNGQELEVIFAGHQMSGDYLIDLMKYIEDKDVH